MKVAVVGATGLVGRKMLEILEERNFPVTEIICVGSESSAGKKIQFKGKEITVLTNEQAVAAKPDIALFSAGGAVSLEWAPRFAAFGTTVIDNSSAWRMQPDKALIVPEVNADVLTASDKIIANPNCSTIQLVVALAPLHKKYRIKRLVISTYQSVSGSGLKGIDQLVDEENGGNKKRFYKHAINRNCLPQCDDFLDNGYTKEEMKLVNETRKILRDDSIAVTATAVRVPVSAGHSESVNVEFEKPFELSEIRKILAEAPGVTLQDDSAAGSYPMPLHAAGKDEVFVGRLRKDDSCANALNMWIVADNLRKGAATNAIQIAEYLVKKGLLKTKPLSEVTRG